MSQLAEKLNIILLNETIKYKKIKQLMTLIK